MAIQLILIVSVMLKVNQTPEEIRMCGPCFLHLRRSSVVEKVPAGGRVSSLNPDHLKPMRKRKRKEYLSPSEEDSDIEGTVRQLFLKLVLMPECSHVSAVPLR